MVGRPTVAGDEYARARRQDALDGPRGNAVAAVETARQQRDRTPAERAHHLGHDRTGRDAVTVVVPEDRYELALADGSGQTLSHHLAIRHVVRPREIGQPRIQEALRRIRVGLPGASEPGGYRLR